MSENLSKGKTPCLDEILNKILKALLRDFHDMMFPFFLQCYNQKSITKKWKHSTIVLLHKKDNPSITTNYKLIALACTIYKLSATLPSLLTIFRKCHKILNHGQEGFRPMKNIAQQVQAIITVLKDAKYTNKDIYLTYIQ